MLLIENLRAALAAAMLCAADRDSACSTCCSDAVLLRVLGAIPCSPTSAALIARGMVVSSPLVSLLLYCTCIDQQLGAIVKRACRRF